jgi:ABC-2 type transport system ATP-binding protein
VGNPLIPAIIILGRTGRTGGFARMLLRTEQLTKAYGRLVALERLDLEVNAGEIVGLLGPNGSGKSTALRLLLGFMQPTAGKATIAGHDCWHDGAAARRHVTYLPGELRLYENMTGRQLVQFLCTLRGQAPAERIDALARRFAIDVSRPIAQLSSGMKRKVALMAVLLPGTPLLILDEPTNTLDPHMRDELLVQLADAKRRGQAVLFSSHVLGEVERVCDRVAILKQGRLVHLQGMHSLRAEQSVRVRLAEKSVAPPDLPGLRVRATTEDRLELVYSGPMPALLGWLARQPVLELQIEPVGLAEVYQRYHGNER